MIRFTFFFTLFLSIVGNVVAGWGHDPKAMVIGGLFPVLLILAEQVIRHTRSKRQWVLWPLRIGLLAVAACCIIYSGQHLAGLLSGTWMRWLIPIAVDALMILSGIALMEAESDEARPETVDEVVPETIPAPSQDAVPQPSQDRPETVPGRSEDVVPETTRKPSPRRPRTAAKSSPKATLKPSRDVAEDVVLIRAAAAAAGKERLGMGTIKKQLRCGDDHARLVLDQAFTKVASA